MRIEKGDTSISVPDVRAMLDLYGVTEKEQIDKFTEMARQSRLQFGAEYRGLVSERLLRFVGLEQACTTLQAFEPTYVPALLQTKEYARVIINLNSPPGTTEGQISRRVQLRMERQRLLTSPGGPQLSFVVDEGALRRMIGMRTVGSTLMRDQLHRVLIFADHPRIRVRLLPFAAGEYRGMSLRHFTYLRFADPADRDIVFAEKVAVFQEAAGGEDADELPTTETKLYGGALLAMGQLAMDRQVSRSTIRSIVDAT